jgi:hypothetical protein
MGMADALSGRNMQAFSFDRAMPCLVAESPLVQIRPRVYTHGYNNVSPIGLCRLIH